jgi:hypothetical protein
MLNQSMPLEQIVFKAAAYIAMEPDTRAEVFDFLKVLELPENGIAMLYPERAGELELRKTRGLLKCQVCQDTASGLIRTAGGRLLMVCPSCDSNLCGKCGALHLLGVEAELDTLDPVEVLRWHRNTR